jgi:hypothetical protein
MRRRTLEQQWLGWSGFFISASFILALALSTTH